MVLDKNNVNDGLSENLEVMGLKKLEIVFTAKRKTNRSNLY